MKNFLKVLVLATLVLSSVSVRAQIRVSTLSNGTVTGGDYLAGAINYPPSNAFDGIANNTVNRWMVPVTNLPAWLEYRFNGDAGAAISEYKIISGCDTKWDKPSRFPKNFTLSGSNEVDATWTVINVQSNITWTSAGQTKTFELTETARYRAYRFDCTAHNGATDYLSISEIEFWGVEEPYPPSGPVEAASNPVPADQASGVSYAPTLSWTLDAAATSATVYFSTTGVIDATSQVSSGTLATSFSPGYIGIGTSASWRVDTIGGVGTTTGTVWQFTTTLDPFPSEALVETEAFTNFGGWVLDTQFIPSMGSPYLNAHGKGVPVADATTTTYLAPGEYAVWVRTRDWTPDYAEEDKPGRFEVRVDGVALNPTFGIMPADWGWVNGGTFTTEGGAVSLALHDLTGFNGRCDALYLTSNLEVGAPPNGGLALDAWRSAQRGEVLSAPEDVGDYDFVVVGGGIAGTCAAVAAAQQGLTVALIQDRDILGGNASGEIRIKTEGIARNEIVDAVQNTYKNGLPGAHTCDTNRLNYVRGYDKIDLYTGWRAYAANTNADGRVASVDARNVRTGARRRFTAPVFADCTGDGWVGYWAGADFRMGREAGSEFGESESTLSRVTGVTLIPAVADGSCMGNSLLWTTKEAASNTTFPAVPWALTVSGTRAETSGDWKWEAGLGVDENTIYDGEAIRDRLLCAIYGNFYNAHKSKPKLTFTWVPYVAGKRESRRLMGDYIVKQSDVQNGVWFEDSIGSASWSIDLHYYNTAYNRYKTECSQTKVGTWYFPYRALYSRNVDNLFMAGRNISCTHVAFGSLRVMNTGGQMGVAIGTAAALCKKYDCLPRDIYRSPGKTQEMQLLVGGGWPVRPSLLPEPNVADEDWVYVDNPQAEVSGTWKTSNYEATRYGSDYLHSDKLASDDMWVRYTPSLPSNGNYCVQMIWNGVQDRPTAAAVEIVSASGIATNYVNMTVNTGLWQTVSIKKFAANGTESVRILTVGNSGKYVIADAVRFGCVGDDYAVIDPTDYDRNGLADDWERYYFLNAGGVDPDADPDKDGLTNLGEYIAGTDPLDKASFFSIRNMFSDHSSVAENTVVLVWPSVEGRTYKILYAETLDSSFTVIQSGIVATPPENTESIDTTGGDSGFFKIQVEKQ